MGLERGLWGGLVCVLWGSLVGVLWDSLVGVLWGGLVGGLVGGLMEPDPVVRVLLVKADFDACRWFGRWFER